MRTPGFGLALSLLCCATVVRAETWRVTDESELTAALIAVTAGDEIVLADGSYGTGDLRCDVPGTAEAPIVVRAENPRAAELIFFGSEGFRISAPHWHFEGLAILGGCGDDDSCEHAFHVVGEADGFVLRDSLIYDFNAQLKVNAERVGDTFVAPDDGLVERCDVGDLRARVTSRPVTKLNIDGGRGWVVRDNYIHDFQKAQGNGVSFGAFMKSGGSDGLFERNLVICNNDIHMGGARIGLSFGGGGTGAEFCAPAYDAGVPCDPEHTGGTMRNNIIVACSDVGIYLNQASDTSLLHNTLIATAGIDFRFGSSSGLAAGNLLAGVIRDRDGASHVEQDNRTGVSQASFEAWYEEPLYGNLSLVSTPTDLFVAKAGNVDDDHCGRARPTGTQTLGAVEHSLGDCDTRPLRGWDADAGAASDGSAGGTDAGRSSDAGIGVDAGEDSGATPSPSDAGSAGDADAGAGSVVDSGAGMRSSSSGDGGGGCAALNRGSPRPSIFVVMLTFLAVSWLARRRDARRAVD